jgi:hypothetical protein
MKRIFSKTAITLIELVVASVLVIIVLLGMFAINSVLSGNNQDYGQKYLVRSETQITLNHILNNASLAVGSGTADSFGNLDLGILTGAASPDPNSFCIHQGANSNVTGTSLPNDIWLCYTFIPSTDPTYPNQIWYCTSNFTPATSFPSYRGATAPCNPTATAQFLGTAYSITPSFSTAVGSQMVFTMTIQNYLDNSGSLTDPVNNPQVSITGSVSPPQQGMQQP